ncbi:MAG: helix-turn-helix transcriptional regulator [Planctomycetes bacterium]|nr:helix-turn-helix transcriptional regulator [Planctomycetota bacterium]
MSKSKNPPRSATLTEALRWHLKNCGTTPVEVSRQIGIHHASLYRFLGATRGLSDDTTDKLAKYLRLRLVRDEK